jgi:hypothetical protein
MSTVVANLRAARALIEDPARWTKGEMEDVKDGTK